MTTTALHPPVQTTGPAPVAGTARERLALTVSYDGPGCSVALRGCLDSDSVIAFESMFDQLVSAQFDEIVLDVAGLLSLDDSGLRSLERLGNLLAGERVNLLLRDGSSTVACDRGAPRAGRPTQPAPAPKLTGPRLYPCR